MDFKGLMDEKLRKAIKKKDEHSFVIAYELLYDDHIKTQAL